MKSTPPLPESNLLQAFEAAGVVEYLEYLKSGKRIFWLNFRAGVAKGLGLTVGLAVVLALTFWLLTKLVDLPLVGEYFAEAQLFLTEYADKTDYSDEFAEMNKHLQEIKENIKQEQ